MNPFNPKLRFVFTGVVGFYLALPLAAIGTAADARLRVIIETDAGGDPR